MENFFEKEKEIKDLKIKLARYPSNLDEGEKLISIIFTTYEEDFQYSIICKITDNLSKIEFEFYKDNPEYSEYKSFYIINGRKVDKFKSLKDNGIKNNDIINYNILY